jgi:hypothetical protein
MRLLLRFLSLVALAGAIVIGVIDSIQSVASESVIMTPLGAALFSVDPEMLLNFETYFRQNVSAALWDSFIDWVLVQPASIVLLAISLLFWLIAYKREPASRFAVR